MSGFQDELSPWTPAGETPLSNPQPAAPVQAVPIDKEKRDAYKEQAFQWASEYFSEMKDVDPHQRMVSWEQATEKIRDMEADASSSGNRTWDGITNEVKSVGYAMDFYDRIGKDSRAKEDPAYANYSRDDAVKLLAENGITQRDTPDQFAAFAALPPDEFRARVDSMVMASAYKGYHEFTGGKPQFTDTEILDYLQEQDLKGNLNGRSLVAADIAMQSMRDQVRAANLAKPDTRSIDLGGGNNIVIDRRPMPDGIRLEVRGPDGTVSHVATKPFVEPEKALDDLDSRAKIVSADIRSMIGEVAKLQQDPLYPIASMGMQNTAEIELLNTIDFVSGRSSGAQSTKDLEEFAPSGKADLSKDPERERDAVVAMNSGTERGDAIMESKKEMLKNQLVQLAMKLQARSAELKGLGEARNNGVLGDYALWEGDNVREFISKNVNKFPETNIGGAAGVAANVFSKLGANTLDSADFFSTQLASGAKSVGLPGVGSAIDKVSQLTGKLADTGHKMTSSPQRSAYEVGGVSNFDFSQNLIEAGGEAASMLSGMGEANLITKGASRVAGGVSRLAKAEETARRIVESQGKISKAAKLREFVFDSRAAVAEGAKSNLLAPGLSSITKETAQAAISAGIMQAREGQDVFNQLKQAGFSDNDATHYAMKAFIETYGPEYLMDKFYVKGMMRTSEDILKSIGKDGGTAAAKAIMAAGARSGWIKAVAKATPGAALTGLLEGGTEGMQFVIQKNIMRDVVRQMDEYKGIDDEMVAGFLMGVLFKGAGDLNSHYETRKELRSDAFKVEASALTSASAALINRIQADPDAMIAASEDLAKSHEERSKLFVPIKSNEDVQVGDVISFTEPAKSEEDSGTMSVGRVTQITDEGIHFDYEYGEEGAADGAPATGIIADATGAQKWIGVNTVDETNIDRVDYTEDQQEDGGTTPNVTTAAIEEILKSRDEFNSQARLKRDVALQIKGLVSKTAKTGESASPIAALPMQVMDDPGASFGATIDESGNVLLNLHGITSAIMQRAKASGMSIDEVSANLKDSHLVESIIDEEMTHAISRNKTSQSIANVLGADALAIPEVRQAYIKEKLDHLLAFTGKTGKTGQGQALSDVVRKGYGTDNWSEMSPALQYEEILRVATQVSHVHAPDSWGLSYMPVTENAFDTLFKGTDLVSDEMGWGNGAEMQNRVGKAMKLGISASEGVGSLLASEVLSILHYKSEIAKQIRNGEGVAARRESYAAFAKSMDAYLADLSEMTAKGDAEYRRVSRQLAMSRGMQLPEIVVDWSEAKQDVVVGENQPAAEEMPHSSVGYNMSGDDLGRYGRKQYGTMTFEFGKDDKIPSVSWLTGLTRETDPQPAIYVKYHHAVKNVRDESDDVNYPEYESYQPGVYYSKPAVQGMLFGERMTPEFDNRGLKWSDVLGKKGKADERVSRLAAFLGLRDKHISEMMEAIAEGNATLHGTDKNSRGKQRFFPLTGENATNAIMARAANAALAEMGIDFTTDGVMVPATTQTLKGTKYEGKDTNSDVKMEETEDGVKYRGKPSPASSAFTDVGVVHETVPVPDVLLSYPVNGKLSKTQETAITAYRTLNEMRKAFRGGASVVIKDGSGKEERVTQEKIDSSQAALDKLMSKAFGDIPRKVMIQTFVGTDANPVTVDGEYIILNKSFIDHLTNDGSTAFANFASGSILHLRDIISGRKDRAIRMTLNAFMTLRQGGMRNITEDAVLEIMSMRAAQISSAAFHKKNATVSNQVKSMADKRSAPKPYVQGTFEKMYASEYFIGLDSEESAVDADRRTGATDYQNDMDSFVHNSTFGVEVLLASKANEITTKAAGSTDTESGKRMFRLPSGSIMEIGSVESDVDLSVWHGLLFSDSMMPNDEDGTTDDAMMVSIQRVIPALCAVATSSDVIQKELYKPGSSIAAAIEKVGTPSLKSADVERFDRMLRGIVPIASDDQRMAVRKEYTKNGVKGHRTSLVLDRKNPSQELKNRAEASKALATHLSKVNGRNTMLPADVVWGKSRSFNRSSFSDKTTIWGGVNAAMNYLYRVAVKSDSMNEVDSQDSPAVEHVRNRLTAAESEMADPNSDLSHTRKIGSHRRDINTDGKYINKPNDRLFTGHEYIQEYIWSLALNGKISLDDAIIMSGAVERHGKSMSDMMNADIEQDPGSDEASDSAWAELQGRRALDKLGFLRSYVTEKISDPKNHESIESASTARISFVDNLKGMLVSDQLLGWSSMITPSTNAPATGRVKPSDVVDRAYGVSTRVEAKIKALTTAIPEVKNGRTTYRDMVEGSSEWFEAIMRDPEFSGYAISLYQQYARLKMPGYSMPRISNVESFHRIVTSIGHPLSSAGEIIGTQMAESSLAPQIVKLIADCAPLDWVSGFEMVDGPTFGGLPNGVTYIDGAVLFYHRVVASTAHTTNSQESYQNVHDRITMASVINGVVNSNILHGTIDSAIIGQAIARISVLGSMVKSSVARTMKISKSQPRNELGRFMSLGDAVDSGDVFDDGAENVDNTTADGQSLVSLLNTARGGIGVFDDLGAFISEWLYNKQFRKAIDMLNSDKLSEMESAAQLDPSAEDIYISMLAGNSLTINPISNALGEHVAHFPGYTWSGEEGDFNGVGQQVARIVGGVINQMAIANGVDPIGVAGELNDATDAKIAEETQSRIDDVLIDELYPISMSMGDALIEIVANGRSDNAIMNARRLFPDWNPSGYDALFRILRGLDKKMAFDAKHGGMFLSLKTISELFSGLAAEARMDFPKIGLELFRAVTHRYPRSRVERMADALSGLFPAGYLQKNHIDSLRTGENDAWQEIRSATGRIIDDMKFGGRADFGSRKEALGNNDDYTPEANIDDYLDAGDTSSSDEINSANTRFATAERAGQRAAAEYAAMGFGDLPHSGVMSTFGKAVKGAMYAPHLVATVAAAVVELSTLPARRAAVRAEKNAIKRPQAVVSNFSVPSIYRDRLREIQDAYMDDAKKKKKPFLTPRMMSDADFASGATGVFSNPAASGIGKLGKEMMDKVNTILESLIGTGRGAMIGWQAAADLVPAYQAALHRGDYTPLFRWGLRYITATSNAANSVGAFDIAPNADRVWGGSAKDVSSVGPSLPSDPMGYLTSNAEAISYHSANMAQQRVLQAIEALFNKGMPEYDMRGRDYSSELNELSEKLKSLRVGKDMMGGTKAYIGMSMVNHTGINGNESALTVLGQIANNIQTMRAMVEQLFGPQQAGSNHPNKFGPEQYLKNAIANKVVDNRAEAEEIVSFYLKSLKPIADEFEKRVSDAMNTVADDIKNGRKPDYTARVTAMVDEMTTRVRGVMDGDQIKWIDGVAGILDGLFPKLAASVKLSRGQVLGKYNNYMPRALYSRDGVAVPQTRQFALDPGYRSVSHHREFSNAEFIKKVHSLQGGLQIHGDIIINKAIEQMIMQSNSIIPSMIVDNMVGSMRGDTFVEGTITSQMRRLMNMMNKAVNKPGSEEERYANARLLATQTVMSSMARMMRDTKKSDVSSRPASNLFGGVFSATQTVGFAISLVSATQLVRQILPGLNAYIQNGKGRSAASAVMMKYLSNSEFRKQVEEFLAENNNSILSRNSNMQEAQQIGKTQRSVYVEPGKAGLVRRMLMPLPKLAQAGSSKFLQMFVGAPDRLLARVLYLTEMAIVTGKDTDASKVLDNVTAMISGGPLSATVNGMVEDTIDGIIGTTDAARRVIASRPKDNVIADVVTMGVLNYANMTMSLKSTYDGAVFKLRSTDPKLREEGRRQIREFMDQELMYHLFNSASYKALAAIGMGGLSSSGLTLMLSLLIGTPDEDDRPMKEVNANSFLWELWNRALGDAILTLPFAGRGRAIAKAMGYVGATQYGNMAAKAVLGYLGASDRPRFNSYYRTGNPVLDLASAFSTVAPMGANSVAIDRVNGLAYTAYSLIAGDIPSEDRKKFIAKWMGAFVSSFTGTREVSKKLMGDITDTAKLKRSSIQYTTPDKKKKSSYVDDNPRGD